MELIERYLQAVRFWLPRRAQEDIIAELSEDLRAQIEEREAESGGEVTEAEIECLLRKRGSPILVANGYLPQRSLIGPLLFPLYTFVLKIITACVVGSIGIGWLVSMIDHAPGSGGILSGVIFGELWEAWFLSAGMVTVVFAVLERSQMGSHTLESWSPRKLPPLRDPHLIPRSSSAIELAANLFVIAWWFTKVGSPFTLHVGGLVLGFRPPWAWFFGGILLLTMGGSALAVTNLLRPWWTPTRSVLRVVLDAGGAVFFCWLMKADLLVSAEWPGAISTRSAAVVNSVNYWLEQAFPLVVAVSVAILVVNLYRWIRLLRAPQPQASRRATV